MINTSRNQNIDQASDISFLKAKISELESFRDSLMIKQLSYPLDAVSRSNVLKDIPTPRDEGEAVFPVTLPSYDEAIEVSVNNKRFLLYTTSIQTT